MLKKDITYTDYNDQLVTESFYFNISKAELVELELGTPDGGFEAHLQRIIASKENPTIIKEFKEIILMSYGVRSEDGRRFIKSQQLRDDFASSEAYSELFVELATNDGAAAQFINGIVPQSLQADAEASKAEPETVELPQPAKKDPKDMTKEELIAAFAAKTKE